MFFNFVTFMGMILPQEEMVRGEGKTVRLFVFLLSLESLSVSLALSPWQGAVTIDTDDAAGTRCGGGSDAASLCR